MTPRDRRALVLGGTTVLAAVLLVRVLPWTVRSALAAEAGLRERAVLLARARADLTDAATRGGHEGADTDVHSQTALHQFQHVPGNDVLIRKRRLQPTRNPDTPVRPTVGGLECPPYVGGYSRF